MATYPSTSPNHNATDAKRSDDNTQSPQKQPVSNLAVDNRTTTRPVATPQVVDEDDIVTVDLHNAVRGQRVIYAGIQGSMRQIVINAGDTKRKVRLHKSIEKELRDRNRLKKDSDLVSSAPSDEQDKS